MTLLQLNILPTVTLKLDFTLKQLNKDNARILRAPRQATPPF